jgi:uncharacterized protein (UPF0333 family)
MNKRQRRIVQVAILIIMIMVIFPPWIVTFKAENYQSERMEYAFLLRPPLSDDLLVARLQTPRINLRFLIPQLVFVAGIATILVLKFQDSRDTNESLTEKSNNSNDQIT